MGVEHWGLLLVVTQGSLKLLLFCTCLGAAIGGCRPPPPDVQCMKGDLLGMEIRIPSISKISIVLSLCCRGVISSNLIGATHAITGEDKGVEGEL